MKMKKIWRVAMVLLLCVPASTTFAETFVNNTKDKSNQEADEEISLSSTEELPTVESSSVVEKSEENAEKTEESISAAVESNETLEEGSAVEQAVEEGTEEPSADERKLSTRETIPNLNVDTVDLRKVFNSPIGDFVGLSEDNKQLVITDGQLKVGAIWGKYQLNLKYDFMMEGYLYFGNKGHEAADGITFTLQTSGDKLCGNPGQRLGAYGLTAPNDIRMRGVSIEFDTYYNGDGLDQDVDFGPDTPKYDHTAFFDIRRERHLSPQKVHYANAQDQLSSGEWYKVNISWKKDTSTLSYELSTFDDFVPGGFAEQNMIL